MLTAFVWRNVLVRILSPLGSTVRSNVLETSCWVSGVVNGEFLLSIIFRAFVKTPKSSLWAGKSGVKLPRDFELVRPDKEFLTY